MDFYSTPKPAQPKGVAQSYATGEFRSKKRSGSTIYDVFNGDGKRVGTITPKSTSYTWRAAGQSGRTASRFEALAAIVNLTDPDTARRAAQRWIAHNGVPCYTLVEQAIASANAAGDPLVDNPLRRALLAEARAQGLTCYCVLCAGE